MLFRSCGSDIGVTDVLLIFSLGIEILLSKVGRVSKKLTGRELVAFSVLSVSEKPTPVCKQDQLPRFGAVGSSRYLSAGDFRLHWRGRFLWGETLGAAESRDVDTH